MRVGGRLVRRLARLAGSRGPGATLHLEYPLDGRPRYGYGNPPHPELDALLRTRVPAIGELLTSFGAYGPDLTRIALDDPAPGEPCWNNGWFQGLDAVALYGLLRTTRPARFVEVGSGHSTRFARRAVTDEGAATEIVSIDPQPRAAVDALCDRVVRLPLERAGSSLFDELAPGDVLFFDGSHHSFEGSDVTVAFLEIVPRLPPGVLVHFHDVFLPWDYPPQLRTRWYNEQYLLATALLSGERLEVVLPNFFVTLDPALHGLLQPVWSALLWSGTPVNGLSFWVRTR